MVTVKFDVPFKLIWSGVKAVVTTGVLITVKVAEAVLPVPPLVELTLPVVLTFVPAVVALTLTLTAQVPPIGSEPPVKLMVAAPAGAVKVPPQLFNGDGTESTCSPAGKLSVTATPFSATVFAAGFVKFRVKVDTPFGATVEGENDLAIAGGAMTVKFAVLLCTPAIGVCAVETPDVVFG